MKTYTIKKNMVLSISGVALTLGLYTLDAGLFSAVGLIPFYMAFITDSDWRQK